MFNSITLLGNLGADPEWRAAGQANVLSLRVATNSKRGGQDHTEWFGVNVWGKLGETMAGMLQRGATVLVIGTLRTRTWQKQDGSAAFSLEVDADSIRLVSGGRPREQQQDTSFDYGANQRQPPPQPRYPAAPPQNRQDWVSPPQQQRPPVQRTMQFPPPVQDAMAAFPDARVREVPPGFDPNTGEQFADPFSGAPGPIPSQQ